MDQARQKVDEALARSVSPAVLCSFGKDSLLLLDLVREQRPNTPVIWFRTGLDESFGKRMVREWDLKVLRWRPLTVYTLEGEGRTLVQEFSFGGDRLPMFTDLASDNLYGVGPSCAAERFPTSPTAVYPPFDTLLVGWKDSDTHWVKGDAPLAEDGFVLGNSQVFAPLRHLTDDAVRAGVIDRKIPFEPTPDELLACTHCISTMPLPEFRSRYNLKEDGNGPDIR